MMVVDVRPETPSSRSKPPPRQPERRTNSTESLLKVCTSQGDKGFGRVCRACTNTLLRATDVNQGRHPAGRTSKGSKCANDPLPSQPDREETSPCACRPRRCRCHPNSVSPTRFSLPISIIRTTLTNALMHLVVYTVRNPKLVALGPPGPLADNSNLCLSGVVVVVVAQQHGQRSPRQPKSSTMNLTLSWTTPTLFNLERLRRLLRKLLPRPEMSRWPENMLRRTRITLRLI